MKRHDVKSTFHKMPAGWEVEYLPNPIHEYYFPPDPVKVASVSDIVKAADDGSRWGVASWYGQTQGLKGIQTCARLERDDPATFFQWLVEADEKRLTSALTASKLTVNHTRKKAADRGTAIHKIAERYGKDGQFPDIQVPKEHRGYVEALKGWIHTYTPRFTHNEMVVSSKEHRYAGTFDGLCTIHGKTCLIDYKTNEKGRVYTEAHLQAAGYELALYESHGIVVDEKWIIGLSQDGEFTPVKGQASTDDFLAVLDVYNRLKDLTLAIKDDLKAAA